MNEITINHPSLDNGKLILKTSLLGSSKLYYNDVKIVSKKRIYSLNQQNGKPVEIKIKEKFYDAIPEVIVNGQPFEVSKPLKWYEYIWMGLPILLVLQGGAIGAVLGILAVKVNSSIFRSTRTVIAKYLITLGINLVITITYLFIAVLIRNIFYPEA